MKEKRRLHFGVLFSAIDNTCQCRIWDGIVEYARVNDIHLTGYLGTYQTRDDVFESHYETCFETIKNSSTLDGLIIFAGFIAEDVGINKFNEYMKRLPKNLPLVSVSYLMPDTPSILVNNEDGIYSAVEHLIVIHEKREIAFVKGPDGHPEAEERLVGYKKALKAHNIPFDERYVLPGHFSQESGQEAVVELIDRRKLPFDAIAASDDETAVGVLKELSDRHILVPTNVSVTGFDDDRVAESSIPSISTVKQNFFEIGTASANALYGKINNAEVKDVQYIAPVLVTRQSCGCLEQSILGIGIKNEEVLNPGGSVYSFVLSKYMQLFNTKASGQNIHSWATALVELILSPKFTQKEFLHLFNDILIYYGRESRDFNLWYDALYILSDGVEQYKHKVPEIHSVLLALNTSATLIHDIRMKSEKVADLALIDAQQLLRRVTSSIALTFDIDSLNEEFVRSLPEIELSTALIGLYEKPIKSATFEGDRSIHTLIGFDKSRKFNLKAGNSKKMTFSDYSSIENFTFARERRTLFFFPLFFEDEELGVMLLPYESHLNSDAYETLRISVSTAVRGAELLAKVQTLSITDELTGLLNRRGFFQFVYSRLQHLSRRHEIIPLVLFLDMDGLKFINDNYGHKEGDIAISAFSKILKDTLREEDIIGRLGGDEFTVFSSVKLRENGDHLVRRLRQKLDEYNAQKLHKYDVAASIGCVTLEASTKECFEAAMLSADNVLYEEKMAKKKKGLSRG